MSTIRLAHEGDAQRCLSIYAPIVRETPISFEIEPPSEEEFRQRIVSILQQMPWLVCEINGELLGYAYASTYRQRAAFQWCVESSIYVSGAHRRKGVAKALYTSLIRVLQLQGFYNVYAGITLPNPASVALHEAVGFLPLGVYPDVGYKLGRWHDLGWWHLSLQPERSESVLPPLALNKVFNSVQWQDALSSGLSILRV